MKPVLKRPDHFIIALGACICHCNCIGFHLKEVTDLLLE